MRFEALVRIQTDQWILNQVWNDKGGRYEGDKWLVERPGEDMAVNGFYRLDVAVDKDGV